MQKPRADLLTGTSLSLQKDRHVGGGDPLQLLADRLHHGGAPKDNV